MLVLFFSSQAYLQIFLGYIQKMANARLVVGPDRYYMLLAKSITKIVFSFYIRPWYKLAAPSGKTGKKHLCLGLGETLRAPIMYLAKLHVR